MRVRFKFQVVEGVDLYITYIGRLIPGEIVLTVCQEKDAAHLYDVRHANVILPQIREVFPNTVIEEVS